MIPSIQTGAATEMSHDFENKSVGIDKSSISFILQILRNNIYSNKIGAVIREYTSNARDEMVRLGKLDKPIEICLPSSLTPEFTVRDFGRGLSKEQVFHFFGSYGTSDKRDTNDLVGMMGIGCFAGFCYSNSFSITSYFNGKKWIFSNIIDSENQDGKLVMMDESDTDEENGVMISVPVLSTDFNSFKTEVSRQLQWVKYPYLLDSQPSVYPNKDFLNKIWAPNKESLAIMGGITYPFKISSSQQSWRDDTPKIVVYFEIGELEVSASREALQYTEKTKKALADKIELVKADIKNELLGKKFENPVEFVEYFYSLVGYVKTVAEPLMGKEIKFNGVNLNNVDYPKDMSVGGYRFEPRTLTNNGAEDSNTRLYKYSYSNFYQYSYFTYIIDDLPSSSGRRLRISNLIRGGKMKNTALFVKLNNRAEELEFAKIFGMKDVNGWCIRLSETEPDPNFYRAAKFKRGFESWVIGKGMATLNSTRVVEDIPTTGNFYYIYGQTVKRRGDRYAEPFHTYNLSQRDASTWMWDYFKMDKIYVVPQNARNTSFLAKMGARAIEIIPAVKKAYDDTNRDPIINKIVEYRKFNIKYGNIIDFLKDTTKKTFESGRDFEDKLKKTVSPNKLKLIENLIGKIHRNSNTPISFDHLQTEAKELHEAIKKLSFLEYIDFPALSQDPNAHSTFTDLVKYKIEKTNIAILA